MAVRIDGRAVRLPAREFDLLWHLVTCRPRVASREHILDRVWGLSAEIEYESAELEFVSARLSDDMSSPLAPVFFWHGYDDDSVQIDLAVLGTDVTVGGSGDVAVLTFRALSDEYSLEFAGADNFQVSIDAVAYLRFEVLQDKLPVRQVHQQLPSGL